MHTDLRYARIAWIEEQNAIAAVKYVEEHPAEIEAVQTCFGMFDHLTASQIETMCHENGAKKVRVYTIECMVSTGLLTRTGWRGGSAVYSL
jgi:hypothetical protein